MGDSFDSRISGLANRQRGYVKRAQLLALGLAREAINRRVKSGRLIPVHAGVYAVGHIPRLPQDRAYGALLACGPKAVLSHGSAATLYGIYRRWDVPFEVTTPAKRARKGIRTHRATLTRNDTSMQQGLRVTSPARTFLDMAPRLTDSQLKYAFNRLRLDHGLTTDQLKDVLERFRRPSGRGPRQAACRDPARRHALPPRAQVRRLLQALRPPRAAVQPQDQRRRGRCVLPGARADRRDRRARRPRRAGELRARPRSGRQHARARAPDRPRHRGADG